MKRGQHKKQLLLGDEDQLSYSSGHRYAYITTGRPRASDRSRFSHGDKELSS